jgi:cation transport regulator ChaC
MSDGGLAVFAYGSLVSRASAAATIGREPDPFEPAVLRGWRRGFIQARHNPTCEKTFARADGGVPEWILGLGIEPEADGWVNGALIGLEEAEADRLDTRELRYERQDVTDAIDRAGFGRVFTYVAREAHRAPKPPPGAVILASYAAVTEAAFAELGSGELERYRESTCIPDVEIVDGVLVRDEIPPGNPREW